MPWNQSLSVGHFILDEHHQYLFSLLDELVKIQETIPDQEALSAIISELNEYISYHFREEEAIMESVEFPFLELHRHSHQTIAMRVRELSDAIVDGNDRTVVTQLHDFLSGWLVHHIEIEDFEYRPYIAKG